MFLAALHSIIHNPPPPPEGTTKIYLQPLLVAKMINLFSSALVDLAFQNLRCHKALEYGA